MTGKIAKSAGRIGIALFAVYLVVCAAVWAEQRKLLYFPPRDYVATPEKLGLTHEDVALTDADGVHATAWFFPRADAARTIVYFHGNGENVSSDLFTDELFHDAGFAVLAVDYRGYGKSEGSPGERGIYLDADAAWDWLTKTKGIDPSAIVAWGHSLGGGVASYVSEKHHPGATVLDSTFTSVPDVGAQIYWFLPVHLLASDVYPSLARAPHLGGRVVVMHGKSDEVVPYEMGRALYAAIRAPKEFVELRGGHNDGLDQTPGALEAVRVFVTSTAGTASTR